MCSLRILLGALALLIGNAASAVDISKLPDRTKGLLKFSRLSHDFGMVTRGQKLEAEFSFENVGEGPIVLQGIHAACGCTAAEVESGTSYGPGERGAIRVALDTSDFVGLISKSITVMSNEVAVPARTLTLSANIASELSVDPPLADLGQTKAGMPAAVTLVLTSLTTGIEIKGVTYNERLLNVQYRQEDKKWLIDVSLKPDLPTGFLKETITLSTNARLQKEVKIPVRASMVGPISFAPSYLEFGAVRQRQTSTRTIALKSDRAFDLNEAKMELHVNGLKLQEPERFLKLRLDSSPSADKKVEINLMNSDGQAGSVHGKLVFKTTEQYQSQVAIDFYAFFL